MKSFRSPLLVLVSTITLFLVFATISAPEPLNAQSVYKFIQPIGGVDKVSDEASFRAYLTAAYNFILASVIVLSVIMIALGGIQYVASGMSPSQKTDAKSRITHAIGGLILALSSIILLNTISGDVVSSPSTDFGDVLDPPTPPPPNGTESNAAARAELTSEGIFNNFYPDCSTGIRPCSSFDGMTREAMDYIIDIKQNSGCNCSMTAIDGSGLGHVVGSGHYLGVKWDLVPSPQLNNFIENNPRFVRKGTRPGVHGGPRYIDTVTGAEWVRESGHWDVDIRGPQGNID